MSEGETFLSRTSLVPHDGVKQDLRVAQLSQVRQGGNYECEVMKGTAYMSGPSLAKGSGDKEEYPPRPDEAARIGCAEQNCQTQKPSKKKVILWDEFCSMRECVECVEETEDENGL